MADNDRLVALEALAADGKLTSAEARELEDLRSAKFFNDHFVFIKVGF